jgi:hypothetical protein
MSIEAMKMALHALNIQTPLVQREFELRNSAIEALSQAIKQAEKPCQTGSQCIGGKCPECEREWVGLTDEEIEECKINGGLPHAINWRLSAKVLQAKLKEKNT